MSEKLTSEQIKSLSDSELMEALSKAAKDTAENLKTFQQAFQAFCEAIRFLVQIFDVNKGEKPELGECVFGYNEAQRLWVRVRIEPVRHGVFESDKAIYLFEEMHRWTRLPILEKEGD